MLELIFDLLTSLVPDILDDWLQEKIGKLRSRPLRIFLRILTFVLCGLLELAIAIGLLAGIGYLILKLFGIL